MTVSIPPVTFPGTGTSRELTGRPLTSGLVLIMSRPAAPAPGYGRQPAPPGRPGDRSGLWLRNAAAGLCVLAAAAAVVSFTAQYRMVDATRHLPVVAALEAAIPDAAALVFACLGIALALAWPPRDPGPGAEPGLGRRQRVHERDRGRARLAEPGHLGHAARRLRPGQRHPDRRRPAWALARHQQLAAAQAGQEATPLAVLGGLILWLLRLALAPASTLAGFRAWVLEECPVAPGRRAAPPPARPARARAGDGPAEGDQDRPVPLPGHRTARPSRLHPAGSRRPDQRRPGPSGRPEHRRRPRRPSQSRPVRPQRRPL